jgi:hypothetical protein
MAHVPAEIEAILTNGKLWRGGPFWELEFHVSLPNAIPALHRLMDAPKLDGWWMCENPSVRRWGKRRYRRFKASEVSSEDIRDADRLHGLACQGIAKTQRDAELPCCINLWARYANDHLPVGQAKERGELLHVELTLGFPMGGLVAAYGDQNPSIFAMFQEPDTWNVPWVRAWTTLIREVVRHVISVVDALFVWYGIEPPKYNDAASVAPEHLYSEYDGILLPRAHPLASQPGGVPWDLGGGYVLFDLGVDCPRAPDASD